MKHLLAGVALWSVVHFSESAYAQATFIFNNYFPSVGINAPVFDAEGNRLVGTDYVAILYGGPTQDSLSPALLVNRPMDPIPFTYMPMGEGGYFRQMLGEVRFNTVPANS